MAVAYRSSGTIVANGGAGVDMSASLPSGLAIDDIMVFVGMDADNEHFNAAMPIGWIVLDSDSSVTNLGGTVAWKRYNGTETDWAFDTPSGAGSLVAGVIHAFSGCVIGNDPIANSLMVLPTGATSTFGSVNVALNRDFKCHVYAIEDNVALTRNSHADWTESDNQTTAVGSDGRLILETSSVSGASFTEYTAGSNEYHFRMAFYLHAETSRPTIVPNTADAFDFGADSTPSLEFTGSDANSDTLEYQAQIFSTLDVTVDSYSESNQDNSNSYAISDMVGQSFTGDGNALEKATFYIEKVGTPVNPMRAFLYAHSGTFGTSSVATGVPLAISDAILSSALTTSFVLTDFTFPIPYTLVDTTKYCILLHYEDDSGSDYVRIGADSSSPTHGGNSVLRADATGIFSSDSTWDICFYVKTHTVELDKLSENPDLVFTNTTDGADTHPFDQADKADFTVTEDEFDSYKIDTETRDGQVSVYSGVTTGVSQSFTGVAKDMTSCKFFLKTTGSPTGNVTAKIYAHTGTFGSGSIPTGSALATSDTLDITTLTGTWGWEHFAFSTPYTMSAGTKYCIVVDFSGGSSGNVLSVGIRLSDVHEGNSGQFDTSTWTADPTYDMFFILNGDTTLADGTWYWRARAKDPLGTNTYSDWTTIRSFDIGSSSTYTMPSAKGSFALSGKVITASLGRILNSAKRSILLTGKVLTLALGLILPSAKGTIALSGKTISLLQNQSLNAEKGSIALGGKDTTLTHVKHYNLPSQKGSIALGGKDTTLKKGFSLTSSKGDYIVTGKDIALLSDKILVSSKDSILLGGKDADLLKGKKLQSSKGSILLGGKDVTLTHVDNNTLPASKGSILLGGKVTDLLKGSFIELNKGSLALSGKVTDLVHGYNLTLNKESFTLSGKNIDFMLGKNLPASKGSILLGGKDADLLKGKKLQSSKGSILLGGKTVDTLYNKNLPASKGSILLGGKVVTLTHVDNEILPASKGSILLGGKDTTLKKGFLLTSSKGSILLGGKTVDTLYNKNLPASKGSILLGGKDATLILVGSDILSASKGSFLLGGKDVTFTHVDNNILTASKGSILLGGKVATLTHVDNETLPASKGSILLGGKNADILVGKNLPASKGSILLGGKNADTLVDRTLTASKGSILLGGKVVTLTHVDNEILPASKGSILLGGKNASLLKSTIFTAEKGSFTTTGKDATLNYVPAALLSASKGSFIENGKTASLLYSEVAAYNIEANKELFRVLGRDVFLDYFNFITMPSSKGSFTETGKNVNLVKDYVLPCSKGNINLIGKWVALTRDIGVFTIPVSKGTFVMNPKEATFIYNVVTDRVMIYGTRLMTYNTKLATYNGN